MSKLGMELDRMGMTTREWEWKYQKSFPFIFITHIVQSHTAVTQQEEMPEQLSIKVTLM